MVGSRFDELIDQYQTEVQQIARDLRDLMHAVNPAAEEHVDPADRLFAYGFGHRYAELICAISSFTKQVNLLFSRCMSPPDADRLPAGTGKRARHVRLENRAELSNPALRPLLATALELHLRSGGSSNATTQGNG